MTILASSRARSVADLAAGRILATVEIAAPPERIFRALTSKEVVAWWIRPGIFTTTEWTGDVRVGGHWRSAGIARGEPYALQGVFIEVDPPRRLVHTWQRVGAPETPTTVTYLLEKIDGGTRVTLHHTGFGVRDFCASVCDGWETAFRQLGELLSATTAQSR